MSDTLFTPTAADNQDDIVTTMGGLGGLPESDVSPASYLSRELPQFDFSNFLGTASQIAQLFPGVQNRPVFTPGLTDISMTRGFYGPGEDVIPEQYGSGSPGTLFWQRGGLGMLPTAPTQETPTTTTAGPNPFEEAALAAALNMDWSGAYNDYLRRLEAENQDINISNVFTPTNTFNPSVNVSQQQWQQQWQGGTGPGGQNQTQTTTTRTSLTPFKNNQDVFTTTTFRRPDDIPFNADLGWLDTLTTTTATRPLDVFTTTTSGWPEKPVVNPSATPTQRLTPEQKIVNDIYLDVFGRSAEAAGLDYWDDRLAAGVTPDQLRREIRAGAQNADIKAVERQDDARAIEQIYQDLLGRSAEPAALEFWGKQLEQGTPVTTLVERIAAGAQNADVGAVQKANIKAVADEAFVRDAYRNLYGREASEAEVNYHTDAMKGGLGREQFVGNMVRGAQGGDAATINQYRDQAQQLNNFVADFAGNVRTATGGLSQIPEELRNQFVSQLAEKQPELFNSLIGDSTSGLNSALGTAGDIAGLAKVIFESKDLAEGAGNLVRTFGTKAIADGAGMALTAMGIPVVGQVVSAAIMLDSFLSDALGYDSPIQDAVSWLASGAEDIVNRVEKQTKNLFNPSKWSFQEGGLIDMGDDMGYNYTDYYGALDSIPQTDVLPPMQFAGGGVIQLPGGGKVAQGPGGGLDDLIPTSIDGRRAAALSDGEFVIPADVVSMMGDGSSNAGARRLYDLVRQIRQEKTGTSKQAGPLPVGKILERTMR